jgi:hypothetical protein
MLLIAVPAAGRLGVWWTPWLMRMESIPTPKFSVAKNYLWDRAIDHAAIIAKPEN